MRNRKKQIQKRKGKGEQIYTEPFIMYCELELAIFKILAKIQKHSSRLKTSLRVPFCHTIHSEMEFVFPKAICSIDILYIDHFS